MVDLANRRRPILSSACSRGEKQGGSGKARYMTTKLDFGSREVAPVALELCGAVAVSLHGRVTFRYAKSLPCRRDARSTTEVADIKLQYSITALY